MPANANPLQSVPASRSAREFVAVCARHNVPYGELDCLPTLLRELKANKHFAMHFWSVVAGLTDKQAAQPETVLTAIVEAVAGRPPDEVREAGPAQRILLEKLQRLISGQDVEPEEVAGIGQANASPTRPVVPGTDRIVTAVPEVPAEAVLPIRRAPHGKRRRGAKHRPIDHEQIAPVTNPAWTRDESLRLVLVPEPSAVGSANRMGGEEALLTRGVRPELRSARTPPVPVPLSGYAEEGSRRSRATAFFAVAVVVALLAGGSYVYSRNGATHISASQIVDRLGASVRAGYDSAAAAWNGKPAENATATASSSDTAAPSSVQPPPPAPVPASATVPSTASSSPTPSAPEAQPSAAAVPASQAASSGQPPVQKAKPAGLTPEQSMAVTAAYNQMHEGLDLAATAPPESGGLVQVPEGEMNAHLIASRVPVLPDDARAKGITGVVRMQATISRNGYVSRLHVLQGPTELRPAALAAVEAWRYRPYLVNGQPMDVSTIITVDFSSLD